MRANKVIRYVTSKNVLKAETECQGSVAGCGSWCDISFHDKVPQLVFNGDVGVMLEWTGGPCCHPVNFCYQSKGMQSKQISYNNFPSVIYRKSIASVDARLALYGNYNNSFSKQMAAQMKQKETDKLKYDQDVTMSLKKCQINHHKNYVNNLLKNYTHKTVTDQIRIGGPLFHVESQPFFVLISTEAQALYAFKMCGIDTPIKFRQTISMDATGKACGKHWGMNSKGKWEDKKVSVSEFNVRKPDSIRSRAISLMTSVSTETHTYAISKSISLWMLRIRCISGDYSWKPYRFIIDGDPAEFNAITMACNGVSKYEHLTVAWKTQFEWTGYEKWTGVQLCLYHENRDIVYWPKKLRGVNTTTKAILTRCASNMMRFFKDCNVFELIVETVAFIKDWISRRSIDATQTLKIAKLNTEDMVDELKSFEAIEEMKFDRFETECEYDNEIKQYNDCNNNNVQYIRTRASYGGSYLVFSKSVMEKGNTWKMEFPRIHFSCLVPNISNNNDKIILLMPWHNVLESFEHWISRYHLVNIPCLNVLSLGGKQNMDETTTWASETTHFYTKKLDIPTQFRCDIFVSKKVELALELNKLLLFEVNRNEMKKIKKTKMTNSQWSRGKMKGKSKKGDKQLLERYKSLMEYID
eukprot:332717_1